MSRPLVVYSSSYGWATVVVAATTKTAAAKALGWSTHNLNTYAGETGNDIQIQVAMTEPGQAFCQSNRSGLPSERGKWWRGNGDNRPWLDRDPDLIVEEQ